MNWLKKLFGRGGDEKAGSEAMSATPPLAGDAMQDEAEQARVRERMEREMEEQKPSGD